MKPLLRSPAPPRDLSDEEDPFRYGWRYVHRTLPDGTEDWEQVPLTSEDVLFPEEEDFIVQTPPHVRDFVYCHTALEAFYEHLANVVVLGDCRIDWGVLGIRPMGPDIVVLFNVREWLRRGTFRIAEEGGRPVLVMEITSPSTRIHDVGAKRDLYYRAGVRVYIRVDRGPDSDEPAQVRGYRHGRKGWVPLRPDAEGRVNLAPVPLLLGVEDDKSWLYNRKTGERLPDLSGALKERNEARAKARKEARARAKAEAKARGAEAKAREEAETRATLEQRVRELEEQLRRRRGRG